MATLVDSRASAHALANVGIRFDWLVVAASTWLGFGLYWDGWAHGYALPDSFWTIWHAAFYSGFATCATVILGAVVLAKPQAGSWRAAIPRGYEYAVAGVFVFGVGGIIDTLWHSMFGIEFSTDALLSPSHIILATGAALIVSGPFVAAGRRMTQGGLAAQLPAVLSLGFLLGTFTFYTLYAGPYSGVVAQMAGVELPITPLRRQVFVTEPFDQLAADLPMTIDFGSSFYFRREGPGVLVGMTDKHEPPSFKTNWDAAWRDEVIAQAVHRVPVLEHARIAHTTNCSANRRNIRRCRVGRGAQALTAPQPRHQKARRAHAPARVGKIACEPA